MFIFHLIPQAHWQRLVAGFQNVVEETAVFVFTWDQAVLQTQGY